MPDTLRSADTVAFLEAVGCRFAFVAGRGKIGINPRADDGHEINFLDAPVTAEAALRHLARGGNVGVLPEHGNPAVILLDVDAGLRAFVDAFPDLITAPRIVRANAPDRAKFIAAVDGACPPTASFASADHTRAVEIIGRRRMGVVAGTHETGAEIVLEVPEDGRIPVLNVERLPAMLGAWAHEHDPITPSSPAVRQPCPAPVVADRRPAAGVRDDVKADAIRWFNTNPSAVAAVRQALAGKSHAGKRSPRFDAFDSGRTPATTESTHTKLAGQRGPCWHDYRTKKTLDTLGMSMQLGILPGDMRQALAQVCAAYRAAHQMEGVR